MATNSFGNVFRFTSYGESHGKAIGCIVDGVPPNIPLDVEDIQFYLNRRRPGQSKFVSQRKETDTVEILSGVFKNKTTGHPIALNIKNIDQKSKDYNEISDKFRPGHADITYYEKYKIRDYRGGGRSSARETATRVAAGAIAKKIIDHKFNKKIIVRASVIQLGDKKIDRSAFKWEEVNNNPFFCGDKKAANDWSVWLNKLRKAGNSTGAIIEIVAENIPKGLGSPIYKKLDSHIAEGLMSINAVKGVEIGSGFEISSMLGSDSNDEIFPLNKDKYYYKTNHAGGILGGISNGEPIIARFAVKPTSSILIERNSIDMHNNPIKLKTKGRHDPCVGIRSVPIAEAMMYIIITDQVMMHEAQIGPLN